MRKNITPGKKCLKRSNLFFARHTLDLSIGCWWVGWRLWVYKEEKECLKPRRKELVGYLARIMPYHHRIFFTWRCWWWGIQVCDLDLMGMLDKTRQGEIHLTRAATLSYLSINVWEDATEIRSATYSTRLSVSKFDRVVGSSIRKKLLLRVVA